MAAYKNETGACQEGNNGQSKSDDGKKCSYGSAPFPGKATMEDHCIHQPGDKGPGLNPIPLPVASPDDSWPEHTRYNQDGVHDKTNGDHFIADIVKYIPGWDDTPVFLWVGRSTASLK